MLMESQEAECDGLGMWHVRGRTETYTGFWWANRKEKRTPVRPRRRWENDIKMWKISWLAVAYPCRCLWSL